MSQQLDKIYKKNMQNPWQTIETETIIIDPSLQSSFELNDVGSTIWNLIDGNHSLDDITENLKGVYDVSDETIQKDLTEFILDLKNQNLIVEVHNEL